MLVIFRSSIRVNISKIVCIYFTTASLSTLLYILSDSFLDLSFDKEDIVSIQISSLCNRLSLLI